MSNAQKILDDMARHPHDWRIEQVITVASAYGLTVHCPGGSHHIVRHRNGRKISIPAHRPIKPTYIRQFVRLVHTGAGDAP